MILICGIFNIERHILVEHKRLVIGKFLLWLVVVVVVSTYVSQTYTDRSHRAHMSVHLMEKMALTVHSAYHVE